MGHVVTASVCYWPERIEALERLRKAGSRIFRRRPRRLADALLKRLIKNHETWKARRLAATSRIRISWCCPVEILRRICRGATPVGSLEFLTQPLRTCATEYWWPPDAVACRLGGHLVRAHGSYFVSSENVRLVERMLGCRLLSARAVRNPFNVDYAVQCPFPEENGCWRLACVARLEPAAKGQDLLLEVLQQDKWRERSVKVSLFGEGA